MCPGPRTSTAYTDLHVMDDDSVLLVYVAKGLPCHPFPRGNGHVVGVVRGVVLGRAVHPAAWRRGANRPLAQEANTGQQHV